MAAPVVWGYAAAAVMTALVFLQQGVLAILLAPVALLLHAQAALRSPRVAASHHRFLLRTWLYAALLHALLYAVLLLKVVDGALFLGALWDGLRAASGEGGLERFLAIVEALIEADQWAAMEAVIVFALLHLLSAALLAAWLAVRLIRRWLRWCDGLPA